MSAKPVSCEAANKVVTVKPTFIDNLCQESLKMYTHTSLDIPKMSNYKNYRIVIK